MNQYVIKYEYYINHIYSYDLVLFCKIKISCNYFTVYTLQ